MDDIETITYQRQKGGKRRSLDMSDLPKREMELLVDQKDRVCSCCGIEKKQAGFNVVPDSM